MNVMLYRGDANGKCDVPDHTVPTGWLGAHVAYRHLIKIHTRRLIEQATGQMWTGNVTSTHNMSRATQTSKTRGWITIWLTSGDECARPDGTASYACAQVGGNPGVIWFNLTSDCEMVTWNEAKFLETYAHELGHALGFFHTRDANSMMHGGGGVGDLSEYSVKDYRHMRHAFSLGTGHLRQQSLLAAPADDRHRGGPVIIVD